MHDYFAVVMVHFSFFFINLIKAFKRLSAFTFTRFFLYFHMRFKSPPVVYTSSGAQGPAVNSNSSPPSDRDAPLHSLKLVMVFDIR